MTRSQLNKTVHKWLSLFVGIQLIIWLSTGLYFNLMDHEKAGGNENRLRVQHKANLTDFKFKPISELGYKSPKSIQLIWILGTPYYQLTYSSAPHGYQKQDHKLIDVQTGTLYEIDKGTAKEIATLSYQGSAGILHPELVSPPISELPQQENDVWKISVEDDVSTNIYLDALTGRVIAHINDDRRLRDLMFKLHFMDYFNKGSFNHWLIILFALGTLMLSVTGAIWVVQLIKSKQLSLRMMLPSSRAQKK